MGRKKRKVEVAMPAEVEEEVNGVEQPPLEYVAAEVVVTATTTLEDEAAKDNDDANEAAASSGYAMTSHSGEIIHEDMYVSDGSADSDDADETEVVLTSSRMGIMRRGLHQQMTALQQPNRQWTRQAATTDKAADSSDNAVAGSQEETEQVKRQREEDELAQLDPAQRAARLLVEKQRREAEAKIEARRIENEDNVMLDPALFSKRTAFDIRFDQIEDKPWHRGAGTTENLSEFFNYGLSEEDWLEYSEQQLLVRQELIDASRQKRPPDPTIVPIQPRARDGAAAVTVAVTVPIPQTAAADGGTVQGGDAESQATSTGAEVGVVAAAAAAAAPPPPNAAAIGPAVVNKLDEANVIAPKKRGAEDVPVGVGGAWGAGAAPGSLLARLMEEQEEGGAAASVGGGGGVVVPTDPLGGNVRKSEVPRRDSDDGRHGHYGVDGDDHHHHHPPPPPVKNERDSYYARSGGEPDDYGSHRDAGDHYHEDYDRGGPWQRPPPPPEADHYGGRPGGWPPPPPPSDAYYPPPPPPAAGYYGGGRGGRDGGGRFGGRDGGRDGGRGGGRGGRGYYERDAGGDYYQESHSGWKRPRDGGDPRRRR